MDKEGDEPSAPVVVVQGELPPSTAITSPSAAIKVNNAATVVKESVDDEVEQVPRLKKCDGGDSSDNVSPGDDYLDGVGGDIDEDDDEVRRGTVKERTVISGGREGGERVKRRVASGSSRSSTPKRFSRSSARTAEREEKRTRSHSRSKVLTERVLFFEQVWQGGNEQEGGSESGPSTSASHGVKFGRSRSSRDLESEFASEIDALEKRLERQKQRFKSGDVFFEKVTLRHTPNQSGYLSPVEFLQESRDFSRSETHLNRSRLTSPTPLHSIVTRSRTVSYETVENIGVEDDGEEEDIFVSMSQQRSPPPPPSKSPVYDELLAHSSSSGGRMGEREAATPSPNPATMTRSETRSHVIPGRVSIKYEAVDSPSSTRSRTPSEDVSEMSHSASTSTSSRNNVRLAKYEFLGVTADAISRSRTPSGGTSLSSLRSASPRMGDSSGSLGGPHHFHHQEHHQFLGSQGGSGGRRLIVTTTTTTTSEMKSVRMARSPSSGIGSIASPTSEASPRVGPQEQPNETDESADAVITRRHVKTTTKSYHHDKSGTSSTTTVMSPSGSESDELYGSSAGGTGGLSGRSGSRSGFVSGERSPLPSAAAQEWYTQYKSKVAHATPSSSTGAAAESTTPGRFETDVTKSAKSRAAYFDSHIAEIKGTCIRKIHTLFLSLYLPSSSQIML